MTRRSVVRLLGCLCPCMFAIVSAQAPPTQAADRAKILGAAKAIMDKARYCTLVTIGQDGFPQARLMDPFAPEDDMTVWMATNPVTRKVAEIKENPRVVLAYTAPEGQGYVTIAAHAEVVGDPAEKARRWKEDWIPFYADKNRGGDYVLIRVKPRRLEIVSYEYGLINDPTTWRPIAVEFP